MASIDISQIIETTAPAVPQIYAYTTPEIVRHNGWTKIGYTEQDVREFNFGNDVTITHLGEVDSLDDQTLGRIELGGRYAVDDKMNLYGYVNYTMGSDYDDMTAGLGFMYRWY